MTDADALAALEAAGDPATAAGMAGHHKAPRRYLGVATARIDALVAGWRAERDVAGRVRLAVALWDSDLHEARIAAAKLLIQARIPADEPLVWAEVLRWVPQFDALAIADQACKAIERRLFAAPERLDVVAGWTEDPNPWVRRAALVATAPWTKQNHPSFAETEARERILGWAAALAADRDRVVQQAVAGSIRSLSAHDPVRARAFLDGPGAGMKSLALREGVRRG